MAHVPPARYEDLGYEARQRWDARYAVDGEVTHMKQTLLHSPAAYDALMQWFPLRDAVLPHLGERGVVVLSYAISTTNDCLLCSLYFRRALLERGEDPAEVGELDESERDLEAFGRALAANGRADADLTARLRERYGDRGLVEIVAYAALMSATNLVNTALDVDLDAELLALHASEHV